MDKILFVHEVPSGWIALSYTEGSNEVRLVTPQAVGKDRLYNLLEPEGFRRPQVDEAITAGQTTN